MLTMTPTQSQLLSPPQRQIKTPPRPVGVWLNPSMIGHQPQYEGGPREYYPRYKIDAWGKAKIMDKFLPESGIDCPPVAEAN